MSDTPNSPTPAPKSGGKGLLIGAVALAGVAAAGAMLFMKNGATPPASAPQASAPVAPPAPVPPPAPKLFSEAIGDVEATTAFGSVALKGVKTVNANLTKDDVIAALKGDLALLSKLNAEAVTAESLIWVQKGVTSNSTTYEALEARAIKAGVIGTLVSAKGTSIGRKGEKQETHTTFEGVSVEALDVPLMVRWFVESDPEGKAELKSLHGAYVIKSMKVAMEGANVDFGAFTFAGSKVRPARRSVNSLIADLQTYSEQNKAKEEAAKAPAAPQDGKPAPEAPKEAKKPDEAKLFLALLDLFSSFEVGKGAIEGIKISAKEPKNDGPSGGEVRKITFGGGAMGGLGMEGMSITGNDGSMSIGKVDMRGDLTALFMVGADKAMRASADTLTPADKELQDVIRARLAKTPLPDLSFGIENVSGDFPNQKGKPEAGRLAFTLGRFALTSGGFVSVTPTRFDYLLEKLDVPLPKDSRDATAIALREMGMERINLGARVTASWNEATQGLTIKEISTDVAQLARLAINGEIGNVPRAFFEDPKTNWPSAMGATINSLVIDVENKGGLAKLADIAAREQKKTGEQMRKEFATIAPLLIAGVLAGHPDSGKVAQAVADFIRNLNSLHLKVTAAGPNGIVLTDLVTASSNPAEFAQKLRFEIEGK
ncbi:MAG: hypothetical protein LCH39_04210 [Proteobacteria bacterium]|nr:hypothetical protein [Pseudomonadota bacterium]